MKAFKLKEAITVFADEAQTRPLYHINAGRVIDFSATYTINVAGNLLILALMSVIADEFSAVPTALPMIAASLIMVIVGLAACFVPARRALAVQPTEAVISAQ